MTDTQKAELKLLEACAAMVAVLHNAQLTDSQHLELRALYHTLQVCWHNYFEAKRLADPQLTLFGGGWPPSLPPPGGFLVS